MKFLQLIKKGATAPTPEEGVLYYDENTESLTLKKSEPIPPTPVDPYAQYLVDLGLPSGLKWMSMNVGATSPEQYGKYFQWGDTVGYEGDEAIVHSTWDTCPWGTSTPPMEILDAEHDAATQNLGSNYRMPTKAECEELTANTTSIWIESGNTEFNGVAGQKFTSKTDSSKYIFIPASGYYNNNSSNLIGMDGYCWSSSLNISNLFTSYYLYTSHSYPKTDNAGRLFSNTVRAVHE